jgi:hypothetical protein
MNSKQHFQVAAGSTGRLVVNVVAIILTTLLAVSCSMPTHLAVTTLPDFHENLSQLKNIVIKSYGSEKFSGLLGLMSQQNGMYFFLLDATGIKLAEVEVYQDGRYTVKNGLQKLKESRLPQILAQSLRNIYMVEPFTLPCADHYLQRLCREEVESGQWLKYSRLGPFTSWKVLYKNGNHSRIIFTRPWVGLEIILTEIDE